MKSPALEPKGRAGCPHPAAGRVGRHGQSRRGEDTAPYPPRSAPGINARKRPANFLSILLLVAMSAAGSTQAGALSTDAERHSFRLADTNLIVELVASEPDVRSPVAITWDAKGRMFVAEMIDYPTGPTAGQVRMLEDRDGDGRYESSTVFADKLDRKSVV